MKIEKIEHSIKHNIQSFLEQINNIIVFLRGIYDNFRFLDNNSLNNIEFDRKNVKAQILDAIEHINEYYYELKGKVDK